MKQIIGNLYIWYLNYFPINRGKHFIARLLTKLWGSFIVKTKENLSLEIFLSSQMDTTYFNPNFEKNNRILREINKLEEGHNFLDIGANIGYYSILASQKVGNSGRVYSFEPSSREFRRLLKNIELNNCKNIIPNYMALSEFDKEISFFIAHGHTGLNSMMIEDQSVYRTSQIVKSMRLDTYFNSEILKFKLVKIDVEGAELFVLKGMKKILEKALVQRIIVEITPRFFKSFSYEKQDIYDFLSAYGYKPLFNSETWQYDEIFVLEV